LPVAAAKVTSRVDSRSIAETAWQWIKVFVHSDLMTVLCIESQIMDVIPTIIT